MNQKKLQVDQDIFIIIIIIVIIIWVMFRLIYAFKSAAIRTFSQNNFFLLTLHIRCSVQFVFYDTRKCTNILRSNKSYLLLSSAAKGNSLE